MKFRFYLFLVAPSLLIVTLFVAVNYFILYPSLEKIVVNEKKHEVKVVTLLAAEVIYEYIEDYKNGEYTKEQAQELALQKIRELNFDENKEKYFWIMETYPTMLMHPYRKDLEGKDLTNFTDPKGKKIFTDALELVTTQHEGYLEYLWENNPQEFNPKMSFVMGIDDWDWIIGASVLTNDIDQSVLLLKKKIIRISISILGLIVMLTSTIIIYGIRTEKNVKTEKYKLIASEEKFRNLFHNSSDIIIISDFEGRILDVNNKVL